MATVGSGKLATLCYYFPISVFVMGFPDFLCIGARKAGTTWLHMNLAQHPQIWLPPVKEVHYLDHRPVGLFGRLFGRASYLRHARLHLRSTVGKLGKGSTFDDLRWAANFCLRRRSDDWYSSIFPELEGPLKGEVCPGYARLSLERIASLAQRKPQLKVIYLIRDPLECAWSGAAAHFAKKKGAHGLKNTRDEDIERYLVRENSVSHLRYARNLANWKCHFPDEQILTSFYDDLKSDPASVFTRVLDFLGVDATEDSLPEDVKRMQGSSTAVGRRSEIPERYRHFLAELHTDSLVDLNDMLPNEHTAQWLETARQARNA
jgi:hypothetical protein